MNIARRLIQAGIWHTADYHDSGIDWVVHSETDNPMGVIITDSDGNEYLCM